MMALLAGLAFAGAKDPIRRLALVAGANQGGVERTRLRYANSDARSVAEVLSDLGGVAPDDAVILEEPTVQEMRTALAELGDRAAGDHGARRVEVVMYYSGHSDERGLLLGEQRYAYDELRADLDALVADVRIAILDSCSSGALVLRKGGTAVPAFLVDESSQIAGHAFLTSSSADEASQEAGRIGGSFFTHALVTGLRGAADADGDQRVTLQEAYDFAHVETLSQTGATQRGTQHPQYEFDLIGTGDLVITDLAATTSGMVLDEAMSGRVHVWDERGKLVAELFKSRGRSVELGLAGGRYRVTLSDDESHHEGRFELVHGRPVVVEREALRPVQRLATQSHGTELSMRPVAIQAWPRPADASRKDHVVFGLATGSARLNGFSLGLASSTYTGGVRGLQLAPIATAGSVGGWQVGWIASKAQRLAGVQTGLINSAGAMQGMQLGVINQSESLNGVSVGLINVAKTGKGFPIGAINVIEDGIFDVEVWSSDLSLVNVGLKSGTRRFYTLVATGGDPGDEAGAFSIGGALGVRPVWRGSVTIDVDVFVMGHFPELFAGDPVVVAPALRTQVGFDVTKQLGGFAGLSLGGQVSAEAASAKITHMPSWDLPVNETGQVRLYPGWFMGVRF